MVNIVVWQVILSIMFLSDIQSEEIFPRDDESLYLYDCLQNQEVLYNELETLRIFAAKLTSEYQTLLQKQNNPTETPNLMNRHNEMVLAKRISLLQVKNYHLQTLLEEAHHALSINSTFLLNQLKRALDDVKAYQNLALLFKKSHDENRQVMKEIMFEMFNYMHSLEVEVQSKHNNYIEPLITCQTKNQELVNLTLDQQLQLSLAQANMTGLGVLIATLQSQKMTEERSFREAINSCYDIVSGSEHRSARLYDRIEELYESTLQQAPMYATNDILNTMSGYGDISMDGYGHTCETVLSKLNLILKYKENERYNCEVNLMDTLRRLKDLERLSYDLNQALYEQKEYFKWMQTKTTEIEAEMTAQVKNRHFYEIEINKIFFYLKGPKELKQIRDKLGFIRKYVVECKKNNIEIDYSRDADT